MSKLFSKDWWKSLLVEQKLSAEDRRDIIVKFLKFAKKELSLKVYPKIIFTKDENVAKQHRALGFYKTQDNTIEIYIKNRNLADILRTLAHELVHEKQNQDGRIKSEDGKDGSEIENEANAVAGVLMRKFGKKYPEIYE